MKNVSNSNVSNVYEQYMNVSRVDNVYAASKQMSTEDLVLGGAMGLRTATGIKSQSPRRHSGQN